MSVVKLSKGDFRVRSKGDTGLEDRTVEQDDGFGRWVWGVAQIVDAIAGAGFEEEADFLVRRTCRV